MLALWKVIFINWKHYYTVLRVSSFHLCLSETWLTEKNDCNWCLVDGYNHFVTYRRKTQWMWVMIQKRSGFIFLKTMEDRVKRCSKNWKPKEVIYNPPRTNKPGFINQLDSSLQTIYSPSLLIRICGDFISDICRQISYPTTTWTVKCL